MPPTPWLANTSSVSSTRPDLWKASMAKLLTSDATKPMRTPSPKRHKASAAARGLLPPSLPSPPLRRCRHRRRTFCGRGSGRRTAFLTSFLVAIHEPRSWQSSSHLADARCAGVGKGQKPTRIRTCGKRRAVCVEPKPAKPQQASAQNDKQLGCWPGSACCPCDVPRTTRRHEGRATGRHHHKAHHRSSDATQSPTPPTGGASRQDAMSCDTRVDTR